MAQPIVEAQDLKHVHTDEAGWLKVVREVAAELASTAVERDRAGGPPRKEVQRLRDAGLLTLLGPKTAGGGGADWRFGVRVAREISRVDGSLGQLLGYHYLNEQFVTLMGTPEQAQRWRTDSVRHRWYWAGVINPRDPDIVVSEVNGELRASGRKTFATGVRIADQLVVNATSAQGRPLPFTVPADRAGIVAHDDWNAIGQRQTESGSVTFSNVLVLRDEVLGPGEPLGPPPPWSTLVTPMIQLLFVNMYVGIALGAFDDARAYTRSTTRPWVFAKVDEARKDPLVIAQYGQLSADLRAATALADRAGDELQATLDKGLALTARERGEAAVGVAAAKVIATQVALSVTSKVFEVMGARATHPKYGFDRRFRDVRTHTLHDPVAYKILEVGDFELNDVVPEFTLYT